MVRKLKEMKKKKSNNITESSLVRPGCKLCRSDIDHMTVVMNKEGDIHVHAPFANRNVMRKFMDAIRAEEDKHLKTENKQGV